MTYITNPHKFSFNDETLRGFVIEEINDEKIEINDIEVKFQINRAIVFDIVIDRNDIDKNELKTIKGRFYKYNFFATIYEVENIGSNYPFFRYRLLVNSIEFSNKNIFFMQSEEKFDLEIIPTKNMIDFQERIDKKDLFVFKNITCEDYNKKYRYLLELNSFIYKTPILIEKLFFYQKNISNIVFQSQNINKDILNKLNQDFYLVLNSHFNANLEKYLDNFLELKKQDDLLNMLLNLYLISDLFSGKKQYNLNDISGFIDLFDGIFKKIDGKFIEKEFICKECDKKRKQNDTSLEAKIDYILDFLEPELKKYEIDIDKNLTKALSSFRNMIRHQKPYEKFDLEKLIIFSESVLRLYVIKHILKMSSDDYNIYRILYDFNIYPLVKHKYKYKEEDIIFYNTNLNNENWELSENSYIFSILKTDENFKDGKTDEFFYDKTFTKELKKIYIDDKDEIGNALKFSEILIYKNKIIQNEKNIYKISLSYEEVIKKLGL
ncbi:hypothetical protein N5S92_02655 [Aliarcobacter cryaerophilus]|uniref:hypothetical protein n=1 Tax=Aliarcobacter cryaerophilus TaxID=28198 RepID=UPI0021B35009|nr:hypothetical protein [Aliarcobacter cryaerophilus]MCT7500877.1 hypothetical protein [Aliarcobacter cryaerophilus]